MAKYITKQRRIFLDYLELHPDEPLTAKQIAEALSSENISISAVYRNLSDLEAEGKVRRSTRIGSRETYFQYVDADACKACLHLSCKKCGKTFHMCASSAKTIAENIKMNESFVVDSQNTVIYGICVGCKE